MTHLYHFARACPLNDESSLGLFLVASDSSAIRGEKLSFLLSCEYPPMNR